MYADICIPDKSDLTLTLPVAASPPQPDARVQAEIAKMPMPHGADGWRLAASRDDKTVRLHAAGPGPINQPHFYSEHEFIQYDQPQAIAGDADEKTLTLPIAADAAEIPQKARGAARLYRFRGRLSSLASRRSFLFRHRRCGCRCFSRACCRLFLSGRSPIGRRAFGRRASQQWRLVLAFLGGLILNLMPCVFPVLGIEIVGFVKQAGSERRKVTMHRLASTSGVLLSCWVIAVLRVGGEQLGWASSCSPPDSCWRSR